MMEGPWSNHDGKKLSFFEPIITVMNCTLQSEVKVSPHSTATVLIIHRAKLPKKFLLNFD